ncbi:hypothetical protein BJX61DRAFT_542161 [Aspergillus egyptiacus]|nr:hypothetical protein BJX61DRAFT_542161 [Aspergillus egyptiacus]
MEMDSQEPSTTTPLKESTQTRKYWCSYKHQFKVVMVAWLASCAMLGTSIVVFQSGSNTVLQNAGKYTLALSVAHCAFYLGLDFGTPTSTSEHDPRPSRLTTVHLAFKTVAWAVAWVVIFAAWALGGTGDEERQQRLMRRKGGKGGGGGGRGGGSGGGDYEVSEETTALVAGAFAVVMFLLMLVYWAPAMWALCRGYGEEETRAMYARLLDKPKEEDEESAK